MAKIILHVDHEQRRRRHIDVHGLRRRCKRNNPLLLSWAHEAQSLVSADLVHGLTVAARGAGAHRARPTLQAPCLPATWGRPVLASAADFFLEWCRNRLRGDAVVPSRAVRLLFLPRSHLPAEIPSSCRRRCRDVSHSKSAGPSPVQARALDGFGPSPFTPRPFLCGRPRLRPPPASRPPAPDRCFWVAAGACAGFDEPTVPILWFRRRSVGLS